MGRMADARKRAREKKKGSDEPPEDRTPKPAAPEPQPEPAPVKRAPEPPAAAEPGWVSREESLVFPAEAPGEPRAGRIELPPSGLAEDILARADARALAAQEAAAPAAEPEPALAIEKVEAPRAHNLSFFAAPQREERKAVEATEHLATFFLAGEEYGVDVRLVQEIIRVAEVTRVPRAPEFIKGVINLRGRIIPVIDLKRKLGLGEVEPSKNSRIVVVKLRERLIGLLVDGASQVLKVPLSSVEAAPDEVVEIEAGYIRGVAKLEKRLIILMELQKILAMELRATEGLEART